MERKDRKRGGGAKVRGERIGKGERRLTGERGDEGHG